MAPGKLKAVTTALAADSSMGIVGHGISEVFSDGRQHTELVREVPRFRIDSIEGARTFRLRKSFLGTSRMTARSEVLRKIGKVPGTLRIEADEYLFTLAGVFSDVMVLRESLTFYRLHESNAFQISDGSTRALRRKQEVLEALAESLKGKLAGYNVQGPVANTVVESIETEANLIRLSLDRGFPWETISTELRSYRIMNENASTAHWVFKGLSLLPACVMSSRLYYALRQRFAQNGIYRKAREKWLPFLQPPHVDRYRTTRP